MKKIIYLVILLSIIGFSNSCTDDFAKVNSDPNKLSKVSIQDVFPGTVYKTLNCTAALNYNFAAWYSRYVVVAFFPSELVDMRGYVSDYYVGVLKDIKTLEIMYVDKPEYNNRYQMLMTWKAYVYSIIVSSWGGMPMSEAIKDNGEETYKYDTELEMYTQILSILKKSSESFNTSSTSDIFTIDPVFPSATGTSDIVKWRKFANTMRLEVALRIQNIAGAQELAKTNVEECMNHEDWMIASLDDIVKGRWGTNINSDASYYYTKFLKSFAISPNYTIYPRLDQYFYLYLKSYNDPRLTAYADPSDSRYLYVVSDTISRVSTTNSLKRDLIAVQYTIPYLPGKEIMPTPPSGWVNGIDPNSPGGTGYYQNPYSSVKNDLTYSGININFIKVNAQSVIYSWADACFLMAEAKIKYGVGSKTADQYYYQGVDASFLQYGFSTQQSTKYKAQDGIKWNTNGVGLQDYLGLYSANINGAGSTENNLEQIYKQKYIADFFNGNAGWTLERRTRVLNFPPYFYNGSSVNEGSNGVYDFIPERLLYSAKEISDNKQAYYGAIDNLQKSSSSPNPSHWGDNFYTSLQIAKPNSQSLSNWETGVLKYNNAFVRKFYGKTEEEFVIGAQQYYPSVKTIYDLYLTTTINYKVVKVISTYNP